MGLGYLRPVRTLVGQPVSFFISSATVGWTPGKVDGALTTIYNSADAPIDGVYKLPVLATSSLYSEDEHGISFQLRLRMWLFNASKRS